MRWKLSLAVLIVSMLACTAFGLPILPTESVSISEAEVLADTPAPYADDTSLPPTIAAPIIVSSNITTLHMLTELDGWAISERAILRTTDGGYTWYNVSPPGVTEFGYGTANTFLNASRAWIMVAAIGSPYDSSLLYRTDDGGLNWTVYQVPFGSGEIVFTDENIGWMMASLGVGAGSNAVAIYRTEDGGVTWTQAFTNDPTLANSGDSLPLGGLKASIIPLDTQTAWVGGVVYAPETFYFFKSVDGGQTWAPQTIPAAPGMQNTEISIDNGPIFTTPVDAILPIRFSGETYRTGFYVTKDAGVNWEFLTFMPGNGSVDFVTPSDGFFWNGEILFVTADGGKTWTNINSDVLFGDSFSGMDFVNTRTGWVWTYDQTGQYNLFKTTDGGTTWNSLAE